MISPLLPPLLVGVITFTVLLAALLFSGALLMPGVLLKLIPYPPLQRACSRYCIWVAQQWVSTNQILLRLLHAVQWQVDVRKAPQRDASYLLLSNHQSWVDILLLCDVLHGRAPFPRFFMKHALKYMPIIGQACWAMDFPFMKRHSHEAIEANPELRFEDLETTRRACALYRSERVTLINFLEGTRFTEAKRVERGSPYRHLLRPKAAGLAFALNTMGEHFAGILDVTIAYRPPSGGSILWSWLSGEQNTLAVQLDVLPIPPELLSGDYEGDAVYRERVQGFVNTLWERKDARLERMQDRPRIPAQRPAHP
jgi:1-acyl-sn-glycerol-3-phosphate acyltransferase